jgi:REP element-mobilizing transposase RayT
MTSPSPLLYDTYYHIYNRGVNRENIFIEERNYDLFLRLYEKHLMPLVDTFAYCMLRNHFHICLRTKSEDEILDFQKTLRVSSVNRRHDKQETIANQEESQSRKPLGSKFLSDHFSYFFNAYAKTMNKAYGRTGSLFQHPFGRVPITSDHQFWNVIAYIHQNPQKHGFVKDFRDWKYSSYEVLLTGKKTILNRAETMKWFGTKAEYLSLHSHWVTDVQAGWFAKDDYD